MARRYNRDKNGRFASTGSASRGGNPKTKAKASTFSKAQQQAALNQKKMLMQKQQDILNVTAGPNARKLTKTEFNRMNRIGNQLTKMDFVVDKALGGRQFKRYERGLNVTLRVPRGPRRR